VKFVVKSIIAILLVLVAIFVVLGPARAVAGAEYPFGVGPWSTTGRYCHDIYEMTHLADQWHHSGRLTLTSSQKVTWLALEKVLTKTGPIVPRTDFAAWYPGAGHTQKKIEAETPLINTWSNQNCTEPLMEAPAALSHTWSGFDSHDTFTHFPKNMIHIKDFFRVLTGVPGQ
jgi:hypothetical protein